ncbi:MAG TPA: ArsR family transcriptional regulator [Flavobacteriales bacterium]|nr:ArsR family transcriptional regulator [Flavobacteriales bacterium]
MAVNKKTEFSINDQEISSFAKALSHPARLAILRYLAEQNSCICGDIVDALPLAQSTVSQHLRELKNIGLIKGSIEGPKTCYCIDLEKYKYLNEKLRLHLDKILEVNQTNCC